MNRDQLALRETINAKRPDPADPDSWPDVASLPGRLIPILDLLTAQIDVARAQGLPTDRLSVYRDAIHETREAFARLIQVSPLEAWRSAHPPQLDPLLSVDVCGNPDCPPTGSDELHRRRWRTT